jgi:outer membrane protein assembly factor BamB
MYVEKKSTPAEQLNRRGFLYFCVGSIALSGVATGCGGSTSGQSAVDSSRGQVQISIAWPTLTSQSRYLPTYTQSIVLTLSLKSDPNVVYRKTADRPAGNEATQQTITFRERIRVGTYVLNGKAYSQLSGAGALVAEANVEFEVQENQIAHPTLVLAGTLKALQVNGQPLNVGANGILNLTASGVDASGATVLLPIGELIWTQLTGQNLGVLSAEGRFAAYSKQNGGAARVRVQNRGNDLSSEADITVSSQPLLTGPQVPMFLYDERRTGRSLQSSTARGNIKWKFRTGAFIWSSPVIGADGTIFVASNDGKMYAVDPATGTQKWSFSTGSGIIHSTAAIGADNTVYFGSGENQKIYALNDATGAKKWEVAAGGITNSSPLIRSDGTLLIGVGDIYAGPSASGKLLALNSATGAKIWETPTQGGVESSPSIASDGTVYIGTGAAKLYAINGANGAIKWQANGIYANINDLFGGFEASPAIGDDGTVYIGGRQGCDGVYAFDGTTGALKWRVYYFDVRGCPSIGPDGTLYIASSDESIYALRSSDGSKKWSFLTGDQCKSTPILAPNGILYAGSKDGALYALDAATGVKKWQVGAGNYVFSSPAIAADGTLYFTAFDGILYAVD